MVAASSCSDLIPPEKYDVFLSFRGEDTRSTFTSHLYDALCRYKIRTYKDDEELERGDDISTALRKAISESKLSVIIFSKNYASSTWCLDELVQILQCRGAQFVIPIFYGIDPSDVRKQSGSYADAFVKHEERFKDKVPRWRNALTTAANISGFDSRTIWPESELVKRVVNDILAKLDGKSQIAGGLEGLVGMKKHIQQVESLLCLDPPDVQIVGIWGMGGIGKTTIAKVVFDRLSSQFEACCFIANVREASETKHGLDDLRNRILRKLLNEQNLCMATPSIRSSFARRRLRRTKALIVLDDVSEFSQLEFLAGGDFNLFGPRSRILVTTRNKSIFRNGDKIYQVKELDVDEALELFYSRAFRNISPPDDYTTCAKEVVDYAGGNPLALTILGSVFCHCKSKEDWEGKLDKFKEFPDKKIQNALRLSYDGLEKNEKEIFLDIACGHKGKHIDEAKRMLNVRGFFANHGLRLLIDMSLISVGECSTLKMHDLIQEMGQTIVLNECFNPGQRSRLWIARDVIYVLKHKTGTGAISSLVMSMDHISELDIEPSAFKKMHNLSLLKFERCYWNSKCNLPQGLECLPEALRILHWDGYPLNSLPSKFCPENLVELSMCNSRLVRLWDKGLKMNLQNLRRIDLGCSEHLADVSALVESPNLESVSLQACTSLVQLPSFFQYLAWLTLLDLRFCSNLKILPEMPGNLKVLNLNSTAIEELPLSIWSLEKLDELNLEKCEKLKNLPSSTCRLNALRSLPLYGCLSLESLPVELPSRLEELDLCDCKRLGSLPVELPSGLKRLNLRNCKRLGSLPVELPSGLKGLNLRNCKRLGSLPVELPSGLKGLNLRNCKSLGSLPVELPSGLEELDLSDCKRLGSLPVELPSGLKRLYMSNCKSLGSLPVELPSHLEYLDLSSCKNLGSLPVEFPSELVYLDLRNCRSLGSLPKLPWPLIKLDAHGCTSLETVSSWMRTAPIQGWDQYVNNFEEIGPAYVEEHIFINCLKLEQSAWSNIMADAQLRVMRFATASRDSRLFNKPMRTERLGIVCPGNEIPKWFRYQSGGCFINMKLPRHWFSQGFLGYALCIVVAFNNYTPPDIGNYEFCCETHHKTNNCHEVSRQALLISLPDILNSDHVFVWYFCPDFVGLESSVNREDWVKASEASFDFMLYQHQSYNIEKKPFDLSKVRVKRCGVSLLYDRDFEKLLAGIDEDVVKATSNSFPIEPKQVVEEEDIIIKTKRRCDQSEPGGSGTAIFKEEDDVIQKKKKKKCRR